MGIKNVNITTISVHNNKNGKFFKKNKNKHSRLND